MRALFILLFASVAANGYSQQRVMEVVEAERSFARYALENNTRDAFLQFMDSNAVVFKDGVISPAKKVWEARPATKSKLLWEPAFAVVSTAGDLGVTSGPWQFKPSINDTAIASGVFNTVWIKQANGQWKWILDMGVDHQLKPPASSHVISIELNHIEQTTYDARRYMLVAEQHFTDKYLAEGKDAYNDIADNDVYFVNAGYLPVYGKANINEALVNMSGHIRFEPVGSGVSKDGDIGYVYGYATEKDKKGNYLRVWRRIGRKWTLLLQTITI